MSLWMFLNYRTLNLKSNRVVYTRQCKLEKYWSSKMIGKNSDTPWASLWILNLYIETDLKTALFSISFIFYYHLSGPPRALRSEKNSSISIWKVVFKYSGSTSTSALNKPISLISTSSSQYRIKNDLEINAD